MATAKARPSLEMLPSDSTPLGRAPFESAPSETARFEAASSDAGERKLRFRSAVWLAAIVWLAHVPLDYLHVTWIGVSSLATQWSIRFAVLAVIVTSALSTYAKNVSSRRLDIVDLCGFGAASLGVGAMCANAKGIADPYILGVTGALIFRGMFLYGPVRQSIVAGSATLLGAPLVLVLASIFDPSLRAQWDDASQVAGFFELQAVNFVIFAIAIWGGNTIWKLRVSLHEAQMVGRYRITHPLDREGLGEVWAAEHPALKREVAVKILKSTAGVTVHAQEFEHHVRTMASLSHPSTVRVLDFGTTEDGVLFYAMERIHGHTLEDEIAEHGSMPTERAVRIVRQVARAIAEAHQKAIVHGDIQPSNVMLVDLPVEPDFVKVLDFGLSGVAARSGEQSSGTYAVSEVSSPFSAPELARLAPADREPSPRSDIYSLGALLSYLVNGEVHGSESGDGSRLDPKLAQVVAQSLAGHPGGRFDSMLAFEAALTDASISASPERP